LNKYVGAKGELCLIAVRGLQKTVDVSVGIMSLLLNHLMGLVWITGGTAQTKNVNIILVKRREIWIAQIG